MRNNHTTRESRPTSKPDKKLPPTATSIILLNASMTRIERKGDIGSPCLKPRDLDCFIALFLHPLCALQLDLDYFIFSLTQIRSHAQKYFMKVQKNGTSEHLPPPRSKRKAAHPYPQKSPNNVPIVANNCCSSTKSTPRVLPTVETIDKGNHNHPLRVLPDFAQVYSFIGGVFDPNAIGHLQKLKKMDPIDVETVLLLMRNVSVNLTSPDFEDHVRPGSSRSFLNG